MYVNIKTNYKCIECNSTSEPESVWVGDEQFLRCTKCKHESIHQKVTRTENSSIAYHHIKENDIHRY